jgi:uncharacterized membrane protein YeiH
MRRLRESLPALLALAIPTGCGIAWMATSGAPSQYPLGNAAALLTGFGAIIFTTAKGGILRDVVAGKPSILMRPELYVTAAALSATLAVLGEVAGLPRVPVWIGATAAGFLLRAAAIRWNLALPAYSRDKDVSEKDLSV